MRSGIVIELVAVADTLRASVAKPWRIAGRPARPAGHSANSSINHLFLTANWFSAAPLSLCLSVCVCVCAAAVQRLTHQCIMAALSVTSHISDSIPTRYVYTDTLSALDRNSADITDKMKIVNVRPTDRQTDHHFTCYLLSCMRRAEKYCTHTRS